MVEIERGKRIAEQLRPDCPTPGLPVNLDTKRVLALFKVLTGRISPEEYSTNWWV